MAVVINAEDPKKISDLPENTEANDEDLFMVGDKGTDKIHKLKFSNLMSSILNWSISALNTTSKTLTGAINELKSNLTDGSVTKIGTSTVGSGTKPIYLSSGTPTASSSTVGSGTKPAYLSSGTITASSSTVGSSTKPVFLSSGTITACSDSIPTSISTETKSASLSSLTIESTDYLTTSVSVTLDSGYVFSGGVQVTSISPARICTNRIYPSVSGQTVTLEIYLYNPGNATSSGSITLRVYGIKLS